MHPDETPRQPEARQPEDPPSAPPRQPGFGAGECGDAIWEVHACEGGTVEESTAARAGDEAQPGGRDPCVRGGRFIDLVERRPRREQ